MQLARGRVDADLVYEVEGTSGLFEPLRVSYEISVDGYIKTRSELVVKH